MGNSTKVKTKKVKAAKPLTPEQLVKRQEKEAKEIQKWEREKARPRGKNYLIYLMLIIAVIYITDEVASQIGTQMKTEIANGLFGMFGERSVGIMDALSYISIAAALLSVFYKPLSDRYGRKIFVVINTLGMGVGMLIIFMAFNIPVYILGSVVIMFFVPHDMQVVYIMESAPAKHRAKVYSIIKAVATLGIMLVPLFRRIFMTDVSKWRMVYLVPGLIGVAVAIFAFIFARETDSFIEHRLSYLRMSETEREESRQKNDGKGAQGGVGTAIKFVFAHKQLKWLFIVSIFQMLGSIITAYYQVIMTYGYAETYMRQGLYTNMEAAMNAAGVVPVTVALFMFPLASAFFQLITGFLADSIGRKPTALITAITTLVAFVTFYLGSGQGWSPYLLGLLSGAFVGSFWATGDVVGGMMISESSPTNMRSSILAAQGLIGLACSMPIMMIGVVFLSIFGNGAIGIICLSLAVPGLTGALIFLFAKTHDTKGVDLNKVTGTEWD